jgi:hypothetical protein
LDPSYALPQFKLLKIFSLSTLYSHSYPRRFSCDSSSHDLLDFDFWKLVTAAGPVDSWCLEVVVRLIGDSLELGEVPEVMKLGWITMVPKVKPDGSFHFKASAMRPITVLPEVGKIASRLLASRINGVLVRHPSLLSEAQRGFINDGSIDQCSDVLLDVIEDWRQRAEGRRRRSWRSGESLCCEL